MRNSSIHTGRTLPSSAQEDHALPPADMKPFPYPPEKVYRTKTCKSRRALVGARRWPLVLMASTFGAKVLFVSSFQHSFPNLPKFSLTKRQDTDIQPTTTKAGGNFIDSLTESLSLTSLERIALTCSGNLQMVFSSYYLQPVDVSVNRFELALADDEALTDGEDGTASNSPLALYDREVSMAIAEQLFCKATSKVRVYDAQLHKALSTEDVGIGQLLRLKNLAPKFTLHDAGRSNDGGMWRFYSMNCDDMIEFDIVEEFSDDAWNLLCGQ